MYLLFLTLYGNWIQNNFFSPKLAMDRILATRKRYLISVITDINPVIIGAYTKLKDYSV